MFECYLYYYSMNEIWKPIVGYESLYEVSSLGRVRSLNYHRGNYVRVLNQYLCAGYYYVGLYSNGKLKRHRVHRLVAEAFIPNPDNLPCVNHRDENKLNNSSLNLEWCDHKYNNNYGTARQRMIDKQTNNKLKSKRVLQFTVDGDFICEWPSASEISRALGFSQGNVSACCRGELSQTNGFVFKYVS